MLSPLCVPLTGAPLSSCAEKPILPVIPLAMRRLDDFAMPVEKESSQHRIMVLSEAHLPLCVPLNLSSLMPL